MLCIAPFELMSCLGQPCETEDAPAGFDQIVPYHD